MSGNAVISADDWNFALDLAQAAERYEEINKQMGVMVDNLSHANDEIQR